MSHEDKTTMITKYSHQEHKPAFCDIYSGLNDAFMWEYSKFYVFSCIISGQEEVHTHPQASVPHVQFNAGSQHGI